MQQRFKRGDRVRPKGTTDNFTVQEYNPWPKNDPLIHLLDDEGLMACAYESQLVPVESTEEE